MANYGEDTVRKVLDDLGIEFEYRGEQWVNSKCPMHEDSSPSFAVMLSTGAWICRSGCGKSGDLAVLIQKVNGGDLKRIQARLRNMFADDQTLLERLLNPQEEEKEEKIPQPLFYERNKMYPYLFNRGFTREFLKEWEVGIDSETKSIVIPATEDGKLYGLISRPITGKRVYKNSYGMDTDSYLFGLDHIPDSVTSVIVVEGPLDALWLYMHGYNNVVATLGGGLELQQILKIIKRFWKAILFFDNDDAGRKFTMESMKLLHGKIEVEIAIPPDGRKDPQECNEKELAKILTKVL